MIRYIKITPDFLAASSEVQGPTRDPVTNPGHPTATGIAMLFLADYKTLDFYSINAAKKGTGNGFTECLRCTVAESSAGDCLLFREPTRRTLREAPSWEIQVSPVAPAPSDR